jgi:hypothetical protein
MTDVRLSGTFTDICGRAAASPSPAMLRRNRATGMCRFQRDRFGTAARTSATSEKRTACLRLRRSCQR